MHAQQAKIGPDQQGIDFVTQIRRYIPDPLKNGDDEEQRADVAYSFDGLDGSPSLSQVMNNDNSESEAHPGTDKEGSTRQVGVVNQGEYQENGNKDKTQAFKWVYAAHASPFPRRVDTI